MTTKGLMRKALLVAAFVPTSAVAQVAPSKPDPSAWVDNANAAPHPRLVDIAVPRRAGAVALSALHSFNSARDVDAQYQSGDHKIVATIYFYENGFPDPLLTSIVTDRVILARFGPTTKLASRTIVAVGATPHAAYRREFEGGVAPAETSLPAGSVWTAAAYLHTNFWIVKLRVTGPAASRAEVATTLTELLAGLKFFGKEKPIAVPEFELTECPAGLNEPFAAAQNVKFAAAAVIPAGMELTAGKQVPATSGIRRLCTINAEQSIDGLSMVLRRTGADDSERVLLLGDGGNSVVVSKMDLAEAKAAIVVVTHAVRGAGIYGPFDRVPSSDQLLSLGHGNTGWLGPEIVRVRMDPTGNFAVNYNTDRMRDADKTKPR